MSSKWASGYSTDVTYILGFYRELAPSFLDYVCAINGVAGVPWSRRVRYCELGCGRGFGTTLLAAANPDITFIGIDFNPSHIAEAKAFAERLDLQNLTFREMSFAEASHASDPDLAEFDIVTMHGVYSWVTPSVREDIHEFVRSKLVPAGIFYVSYNAMPGWAVVGPIQHLLQEVAKRSSGDSLARFNSGYQILQTLVEESSAFVMQNPTLKDRIEGMEKKNKRYLAHEFLNVGWQPLYVTEAMAMLSEVKLAFVGSATIAENRLELSVPKNLQKLVLGAPDLAMRELLRDYVVNKYFRRDVYVKGPIELSAREKRDQLERITFALVSMGHEVPDTLRIPAGNATPKPAIRDQVLQRLAEGPASAAELIAASKSVEARPIDVTTLLEIFVHNGIVHPVRPEHETLDRAPSHRLNNAAMALASAGNTHHYLASPVLGSAVASGYFERLIAPLLLDEPERDDESVAKVALERLDAAGFKLQRDGQPVEDGLEAVAEQAGKFRTTGLQHWRALGLVPDPSSESRL